jgi:putative redox protein
MPKVTSICENGFLVNSQARSHTIVSDEPIEVGGGDTAPTPGELLLSAIGSCMADTVKAYAANKQWSVEKVEVELESKRAKPEEFPDFNNHDDRKQLVVITTKMKLYGDLSEDQKIRLREIGGRCPVHKIVAGGVHFIDEYQE